MDPITIVEATAVVIIVDTLLGILIGLRDKSFSSWSAKTGFYGKIGILTLMVGFNFLTKFDPGHFSPEILSTLYSVVLFIEVTSIVENLSRLGINLKFLTKYFDNDAVENNNKDDKK